MPNSIPFDHPSLVLGNIVDTKVLEIIDKINGANNAIESAQSQMNSFISMKRSISMTMSELLDLDVDVSSLSEKCSQLDTKISASASSYIDARIQNETTIQDLRDQLMQLETTNNLESPVDFGKSEIMKQPLSSESLKLDAQFFSFEQNNEQDVLANIESFIKETTSGLGGKSAEISKNATSQVAQQRQNHSVAGTLVIAASCSHQNVALIEPCFISAEKAVRTWNNAFPNAPIDLDPSKLLEEEQKESDESSSSNKLTLLTGAAYGSSFVGMVHVLKSENNQVGNTPDIMNALNDKLRVGGWLEKMSGGVGVDETFLDEVRNFLSSQKVSSHVTLVSMGAVPSISSNKLALGVNRQTNQVVDKASIVQTNATTASEATSSIETKRNITIENLRSNSLLKSLQKIDERQNGVLDVNTLLSAFENYITTIRGKEGIVGVPIEFYSRHIDRQEIIEQWKQENSIQSPSKISETDTKQEPSE